MLSPVRAPGAPVACVQTLVGRGAAAADDFWDCSAAPPGGGLCTAEWVNGMSDAAVNADGGGDFGPSRVARARGAAAGRRRVDDSDDM